MERVAQMSLNRDMSFISQKVERLNKLLRQIERSKETKWKTCLIP